MNEKINLQELAAFLSEKAEISKKDAETFLREFFGLVTEALITDGQIKIKDLGTFKLIKVEDRESVNVRTGERVLIPAHQKVSFSPSGQLNQTINEPFSLFEPVELTSSDTPIEEIKTEVQEVKEVQEIKETQKKEENQEIIEEQKAIGFEEENKELLDKNSTVDTNETDTDNDDIKIEDCTSDNITENLSEPPVHPNKIQDKTIDEQPQHHYRRKKKKKKKLKRWIKNLLITIFLVFFCIGAVIAFFWYTDKDAMLKYVPAELRYKYFDKKDDFITEEEHEKGLLYQDTSQKQNILPDSVIHSDSSKVNLQTIVLDTLNDESDSIKKESSDAKSVISTQREEDRPKKLILKSGHKLALIAQKEYGNKCFWVYLYEENKAIIKNPDQIPIGKELIIPPAKKYQIDKNDPESIKRAKALAEKYKQH